MENAQSPTLLKFQKGGNAKLATDIVTFSLPSGYTCPGAKDCLAKADMNTGVIIDGPDQKYRCFSASTESRPAVRQARWHNFMLLQQAKTVEGMEELIVASFPRGTKILRLHVGGDFFSQAYFDAWLAVAKRFHNCIIYAYTKSINFVKARQQDIPSNFRITMSTGGKFDHLISLNDITENTKFGVATVVDHPETAAKLELEIDHDDQHAIDGRKQFALLLHGIQPADSPAAAAIKRMKAENVSYAYSRKKGNNVVEIED